MKILLAPSETKNEGGSGEFHTGKLLFPQLSEQRTDLVNLYMNIITDSDDDSLKDIFGLKKDTDIIRYRADIMKNPVMKAVERYGGVAFDHLDHGSLGTDAQEYIEHHVIIFSNLFGPIRAGDMIPDYRLKQGAPIGDIRTEKFYNEITTGILDEYLAGEDILDLRAGFYDKFYMPHKPYTTLKFIKDGKVVSHWAKAYRGIVAREVARAQIRNIDDFIKMDIEGLSIIEMQTRKNKTEIIYDIGAL